MTMCLIYTDDVSYKKNPSSKAGRVSNNIPNKMKKTNRETTPSMFTKGKHFISNMQTFHQLFLIYFVLFL